jgi:serine phosphatase RsbU (regulator of sigma subunit)
MTLPLQAGRVEADRQQVGDALLDAPLAIAIHGTDLRYRYVNNAFAALNDQPVAAHIGRLPSEILSRKSGEAVERVVQRVLSTGRAETDDDFLAHRRIADRDLRATWYPIIDADGEITGVGTCIEDITRQRLAEHRRRRSEERTRFIQATTERLALAMSFDQVVKVMDDVASVALNADYSGVALLENGWMTFPRPLGMEGPGWHEVPMERPTLVTSVMTEGRPWFVESPEELRKRLPSANTERFLAETEERAWVGLPLVTSSRQIGVLRFAFRTPRSFGDEDRAFLESLAAQCTIAAERVQMFADEHRKAVLLQRSMLPMTLPMIPGLLVAQRYLPLGGQDETGGDWYDGFLLDDGRVAFSVGDVMGKGVEAAAGMGRLRSAVRAAAFADPDPAAVLTVLDRLFTCTETDDSLTTLVYGVVTPRTGDLVLGDAGHLPALLIPAEGEPQLIDAGPGSTPLGVAEARETMHLRLNVGDTLLLHSDGLVEDRSRGFDEGQAELARLVRDLPRIPLGSFCDLVVHAMTAGVRIEDDVTLLAIHRES